MNTILKNKISYFLFIYFRKVIALLCWLVDTLLGRKIPLFVLCYHSFDDSGWFYSVQKEELEKQINFLLNSGYKAISMTDVYSYLVIGQKIPKYSFVVTIDDGYESVERVSKFLNSKKIQPTLFVISDSERVNRHELSHEEKLLSKEQILEMQKMGWELGSHTKTHPSLLSVTDGDLEKEVSGSKKELENEFKCRINGIAYPKGNWNEEVKLAAKNAGYSYGVTMDDGFIVPATDVLLIPRIGINNTHSLWEFKMLLSPSLLKVRKLLKKLLALFI